MAQPCLKEEFAQRNVKHLATKDSLEVEYFRDNHKDKLITKE